MDKIIYTIKNIHKYILYIKNIIHYDILIHIGIIITSAVASAHAQSLYYDEKNMEGINRLWTVGIFICIYSSTMLIEWAKDQ